MRLIEARLLVGKEKTLQVFVEHTGSETPVSTSDCRSVNDWFDKNPDRLEWVTGSYNLEVSSPGIERPLRLVEDWQSNTGNEITFSLETPVDGIRKGSGLIESADKDNLVSIKVIDKKKDAQTIQCALSNVSKANLVYKPSTGVK